MKLKKLAAIPLIAGLALVTACATGAKPEAMAVTTASGEQLPASHPYYQALRLDGAQGGEETNPLLGSQISNTAFSAALTQSLQSAGFLASDSGAARYRVVASIQGVQQPLVGLNLDVTMTVRYSVIPVAGGAPVFDQVVAATGTGTVGEAFDATTRLRLANEAAARGNITQFLTRLRRELPAGSVAPAS